MTEADRPLRIAIVNDVWHADDTTAEEALDRFSTLTGWASALRAHGGDVWVFQRFRQSATFDRDHVRYALIADEAGPRPAATFAGSAAQLQAIAACDPDVVHVNGLDYPRAIRRLRRTLRPPVRIIVQDHGGFDPLLVSPLRRAWFKVGLRSADALFVATKGQSDTFRSSGIVPADVAICDVMESSTRLRAADRTPHDGLSILWVGRLNANKDPLTVLRGFEAFSATRPDAYLTYVYDSGDLERPLREAIDGNERLRASVVLAGRIPHEQLAPVFARSDLFVLGSHREGSGYAALEALACGVVPVLTNIASFRGITDEGRVGALWTPSDAASLADAFARVARLPLDPQRQRCRELFERDFSWDAIGRRATSLYRGLCAG